MRVAPPDLPVTWPSVSTTATAMSSDRHVTTSLTDWDPPHAERLTDATKLVPTASVVSAGASWACTVPRHGAVESRPQAASRKRTAPISDRDDIRRVLKLRRKGSGRRH